MKKIGKPFIDELYLTENGTVYNMKTNKYINPYADGCFKLYTINNTRKTISQKTLYRLIYKKEFVIDNIKNKDSEKWKLIEGTTVYYCSNYGRVKSYARKEAIILKE